MMDIKQHSLLILQLVTFIFTANARSCIGPAQGRCIPIKQCASIIELLIKSTKPLSSSMKQQLRSYSCGFLKGSPMVCCPPHSRIFTESGSNVDVDIISNHPNYRLLPINCGRTGSESRIVNGENAELNEFPWMALLAYRTNNRDRVSFQCGGSIITEKYILTAAHCIKNNLIGVRVGEYDTKKQIDCEYDKSGKPLHCLPSVQNLNVKNIKIHPGYNKEELINDIALIEVTPFIDLLKENAKPVCLPVRKFLNKDLSNKYVEVTGWGRTATEQRSNILQKVSLKIIPLDRCKQLFRNALIPISDKVLCAKDERKRGMDSCSGDSGGPLQRNEYHFDDDRFIQYGVVSFGPRFCGADDLAGVYTNVARYMDWILDNIS